MNISRTRDKRRRTDLDAFILALIDSGVSTPYEFQKLASLSPGATIPALERLVEAGFVRVGKAGQRRRVNHKTTAAGRKYLATEWSDLIAHGPSGDLDSDLRVALLALWIGGDRSRAVAFLQRSAEKRLQAFGGHECHDEPGGTPTLAGLYSRLRQSAAESLLRGESNAILAICDSMPAKLSVSSHPTQSAVRPKK